MQKLDEKHFVARYISHHLYLYCTCCFVTAYMSIFRPVISDVIEYYRPTVVVLQVRPYEQHDDKTKF